MAHTNKVLRSINMPGEALCVDVFQRPDGTFGFEEYRRDVEDPRGWYLVGHHGAQSFDSMDAALARATLDVAWLKDAL
ncbi:MAG: hypothetical protein AAFY25_14750 [Pseudomonadota bacterium]